MMQLSDQSESGSAWGLWQGFWVVPLGYDVGPKDGFVRGTALRVRSSARSACNFVQCSSPDGTWPAFGRFKKETIPRGGVLLSAPRARRPLDHQRGPDDPGTKYGPNVSWCPFPRTIALQVSMPSMARDQSPLQELLEVCADLPKAPHKGTVLEITGIPTTISAVFLQEYTCFRSSGISYQHIVTYRLSEFC